MKEHTVKVIKSCKADKTLRIHIVCITGSIVFTLFLIVLFGAEGSLISSVISPACFYVQEISDAIRHITK